MREYVPDEKLINFPDKHPVHDRKVEYSFIL